MTTVQLYQMMFAAKIKKPDEETNRGSTSHGVG
jgi:hypothetical protein